MKTRSCNEDFRREWPGSFDGTIEKCSGAFDGHADTFKLALSPPSMLERSSRKQPEEPVPTTM
jgi:hypothetical protein